MEMHQLAEKLVSQAKKIIKVEDVFLISVTMTSGEPELSNPHKHPAEAAHHHGLFDDKVACFVDTELRGIPGFESSRDTGSGTGVRMSSNYQSSHC